jgi:perosamine synthetase
MKIPLFKIYCDEDDVRGVNEVIQSGMYWTTGSKSKEFEKMIAEYLGRKYAIVFNSGTSALHAAVLAHRIKGGEVIVPSFTFIATSNALLMAGIKPVFADIEDTMLGLDPKKVEAAITKRTKAIIPVHYGGSPCMIKELRDIADDHQVLLIEDAAESFGSKVGKEKVGDFGDSAMISFCQNKVMTTGEGGAVVTDSQDVYERLKLVRSHGRLDNMDYFSTWKEMDYVVLGYNYRMSDITAALGISQLKKLDKLIQMRRKNAKRLTAGLQKVKGILPPKPPSGYYHIYQMYTVKVKGALGTRDKVAKYLAGKGISVKVYFYPVHETHFYRSVLKYRCRLPVTHMVSQQVLSLPIYPSMTTEEIDYVVDSVRSFGWSKDK